MSLLEQRCTMARGGAAMSLALSLACSGGAPADAGSGGDSGSADAGSGGAGAGVGGNGANSGGSGDGGPNGGQPNSGGTASGGTSSGGAGSGGTPGEGDDSVGRIQVYRALASSPSAGRATATFDLEEQAAWDALGSGESSCTAATFGACRVTTCVGSSDDPDDLPSLTRLQAGTISISADIGDFVASGTPTGTNGAYEMTTSGAISGGELLTITASGGSIEAFEGTIALPLAPLLTSHAASAEVGAVVSIPVSRASDLSLTWDARGTGNVLQLAAAAPPDPPEGTPIVGCAFDAASGAGTISAEVLALLPTGTALYFFSVNSAKVTTQKGTVELITAFELLSEDKTGYPKFVLE